MSHLLSVSEKKVQYSLARLLDGSLLRSCWFGLSQIVRRKYGKCYFMIVCTLSRNVKCAQTWWTYSTVSFRSVHCSYRIITINCYFYFWEDILAREVIRNLELCFLQKMSHTTLWKNLDKWLPNNRQVERALKKQTDGKGETSGDNVTWQCLTTSTLLSMLL